MDSHVLYSFHQYTVKNYNPNYNFKKITIPVTITKAASWLLLDLFTKLQHKQVANKEKGKAFLSHQPIVYRQACWNSSWTAAQAGCKQRERQSIPQPSANRLSPSLLELFVNCSTSRLQTKRKAKHSSAISQSFIAKLAGTLRELQHKQVANKEKGKAFLSHQPIVYRQACWNSSWTAAWAGGKRSIPQPRFLPKVDTQAWAEPGM